MEENHNYDFNIKTGSDLQLICTATAMSSTSDRKQFNSNFTASTIKRLTKFYASSIKDTGFGIGGIRQENF